MRKNMGNIDRVVRVAAAAVIAVLIVAGQLTGFAAVVLGVLAAVFVATAAVGTCPLYLPCGVSTQGREPAS